MMMIRITLLNVSTIVIAAVDVVVSLDIFLRPTAVPSLS